MEPSISIHKSIRRLARFGFVLVIIAVIFGIQSKAGPTAVSAHSGDIFGPACGKATINGVVDAAEWSGAATQTVQMIAPGGTDPFTLTVYVMNSSRNLYLGFTINDDDFTTAGTWLPKGDGFRIDFDNDNSGAIFTLNDDILGINAGSPQFADNFLYSGQSSQEDTLGGGTSDGSGAASRAAELNHFELVHPICSGDTLDFCLQPGDTVGFRLEYLDAEANGDFGGSQHFPGSNQTSVADIVIGDCSFMDYFVYLPSSMK